MKTDSSPILIWLRHDLRLHDNQALFHAQKSGRTTYIVYIYSDDLESPFPVGSASKWWLHHSLNSFTKSCNNSLIIRKGDPTTILDALLTETNATSLYWNRRYSPDQIAYDTRCKSYFQSKGIDVKSFKGNILVEPWEHYNKQGSPFQVFTPFYKAAREYFPIDQTLPKITPFFTKGALFSLTLEELQLLPTINWAKGFEETWQPGEEGALKALTTFTKKAESYGEDRDFPEINATSQLSPYLHFGEISPRLIAEKINDAEPFIRQLYWRDFAHYLLYHFPHTLSEPLQKKFTKFPWKSDSRMLQAWQKGKTGYPIVDAGMRELWQTGWMHNRVRMIVGSFLVKDLLISWTEGFQWFWDTLIDADLANNTLGWQWIGGCGADAAPYFRIFNPITQGEKFDPEGHYVKKYVPELRNIPTKYIHKPWELSEKELRACGVELGKTYPRPIVDHDAARKEALDAFSTINLKTAVDP